METSTGSGTLITYNAERVLFSSDAAHIPTLEYRLVARLEQNGMTVAATWIADRVPKINNRLAFYVYEGVDHYTKANYIYWSYQGFAGCLVKPVLRARSGMNKSTYKELNDLLFQKKDVVKTGDQ